MPALCGLCVNFFYRPPNLVQCLVETVTERAVRGRKQVTHDQGKPLECADNLGRPLDSRMAWHELTCIWGVLHLELGDALTPAIMTLGQGLLNRTLSPLL